MTRIKYRHFIGVICVKSGNSISIITASNDQNMNTMSKIHEEYMFFKRHSIIIITASKYHNMNKIPTACVKSDNSIIFITVSKGTNKHYMRDYVC